jgi:hypothetical protein
MKMISRALSGVLFLLALVALVYLLISDIWLRFLITPRHLRAGGLALMLAGASFIFLQLGTGARLRDTLKGVLLGLAFVLWGGVQFLPPGPWVTAVDNFVIATFVIDLGLVIKGGLGRPADDSPKVSPKI